MKVGFCCKFLDEAGLNVPELNYKATTISWLLRQPFDVAEQRLFEITNHNCDAALGLVKKLSTEAPIKRMVRLGSDLLPAYTHPSTQWFWKRHDVVSLVQSKLQEVGSLARANDVRLSFHPGQFV